MKLRVSCLLCFFICFLPAQAQREWADFVETYLSRHTEEEVVTAESLKEWEEIHQNPLNINAVTREELLKLPFINETVADSILSYRNRKKSFIDLAELLFIRSLGYEARSYLPLFLVCQPLPPQSIPWKELLLKGKNKIATRLDFPLYQRQGYRTTTPLSHRYWGSSWRHYLRFQHQYHHRLNYGITFEKDAGEPFASQIQTPLGRRTNYPYDYTSFYIEYHSPQHRHQWLLGDYRVRTGEGLLLGTTAYGLPVTQLLARPHTDLRPYRSVGETDYYRGLSFRYHFPQRCFQRQLSLLTFVSLRPLDGKVSGDTLRNIYHSGYHRTLAELTYRGAASVFSTGANLSFDRPQWHIGLTGYYASYSHVVAPPLRNYNRYYLRGSNAAGVALDAHWKWKNYCQWSGELAFDKNGNAALLHRFLYTPSSASDAPTFFLQHRSISTRFVAPFSYAQLQNNRVANEQGLLLGVTFFPFFQLQLTSYLNATYFPAARFRSLPHAFDFEWLLEARLQRQKTRYWLFSYKGKTKEEKISGFPLMEFRTTHRFVLQHFWQQGKFSVVPSLRATMYHTQTQKAAFGAMAALRCSLIPTERWKWAAFAALFFSQEHATRQYAYEPQLLGVIGFPAYEKKGFRCVLQGQWKATAALTCALRWSTTALFHERKIGSGTQEIPSPWKNDCSVQLHWTF